VGEALDRLIRDESGQAMTEYALVAGSLAVGLLLAIKLLGAAFGSAFGHHAKGLARSP
jgi:Flp pilus assembly pilin Flp